MRILKFTTGVVCLVVALILPGCLALGIGTNFGFGRASANMVARDWCLAMPFALCAVGLVAAGLFLIARRNSAFTGRAKVLIAVAALAGVIPAVFMISSLRTRSVDRVEDMRRWLRSIDEANARSGIIKDTNGNFIYVGATNGEASSKHEPAK